jgi:hypothetical protein
VNSTIYEDKIRETVRRLPLLQQEKIYRLVRLWADHLASPKNSTSLEDLLSLSGAWDDGRSAEEIIEALESDRCSTDRGIEAF